MEVIWHQKKNDPFHVKIINSLQTFVQLCLNRFYKVIYYYFLPSSVILIVFFFNNTKSTLPE